MRLPAVLQRAFLLPLALVLSMHVSQAEAQVRFRLGGGSFRPQLSLCGGIMSFSDDDMSETYGMLPVAGLRGAIALDENVEFFVGLLYATDSGNPYYGWEGLAGGEKARLRILPIEIGMRVNTLQNSPHRFHYGMAVQYVWAGEKVPGTGPSPGEQGPEYGGWGWGWKILAGPEWRLGTGRWRLGAEIAVAGRGLDISYEGYRRRLELTGLTTRGYVALSL